MRTNAIRAATAALGVAVYAYNLANFDKSEGWAGALWNAAFVAGPLLVASVALSKHRWWAVAEAAPFVALTIVGDVVARIDAVHGEVSFAGLTATVIQYAGLALLLLSRATRVVWGQRRRATSG